jgi:hypothetical protein
MQKPVSERGKSFHRACHFPAHNRAVQRGLQGFFHNFFLRDKPASDWLALADSFFQCPSVNLFYLPFF